MTFSTHDVKLNFRVEKKTDIASCELINTAVSVFEDLDYRIGIRTDNSLLFDDELPDRQSKFGSRSQAYQRMDSGKLEIIDNPGDTTLILAYSVSCVLNLIFIIIPMLMVVMASYQALWAFAIFTAHFIVRMAFIKGAARMLLIKIVKKEAGV